MIENTKQTNFNLSILHEALTAIASSSSEQIALNENGMTHLDDIFDPMPLDYIPWLREKRIISNDFSLQFSKLYKHIEKSTGHLKYKEQDLFIIQNSKEVQNWRRKALDLLSLLNNA